MTHFRYLDTTILYQTSITKKLMAYSVLGNE
jgi:hypothetical protein